eukprot:5633141-Amphidinium_carterae.1
MVVCLAKLGQSNAGTSWMPRAYRSLCTSQLRLTESATVNAHREFLRAIADTVPTQVHTFILQSKQ